MDAIYVDDKAAQIHIVQGKFHRALMKDGEKRNDVMGIAELGLKLWASPGQLAPFFQKLEPSARSKFEGACALAKRKHYAGRLHYVTTGKCTQTILEEAKSRCRDADGDLEIEVVDGCQLVNIFRDYMVAAAPAVPSLVLPMVADGGTSITEGVIHRVDLDTGVESWVFSMPTPSVGEMFRSAGVRLFARNIRGYQGETNPINTSMGQTITSEPENFWYFNNGITIVCDRAKREVEGRRDVLRVVRPQVINGQQTTRTLATHSSRKASVLTRVIQIPRSNGDETRYDDVVSKIVRATNWQTPIRPSDLVSNDYLQVYLEREFRKRGYQYIRKRMSKGEARALYGGTAYWQVKKEELAQALAGCDLDPSVVRGGKEGLFDSRYYRTLFAPQDVLHYLSRYWLMVRVQSRAWGKPSRAYAKWLVLNRAWDSLSPTLVPDHGTLRWVHACEYSGNDQVLGHLDRGIDGLFKAALAYFRASRGHGEEAKDISTFFQRANLPAQFEKWWTMHGASRRGFVIAQFKEFSKALGTVDLRG